MVNESKRISKQPWFWVLAATIAVLVVMVVWLITNTEGSPKRNRETPIPVPSVAPFVEQTITEEEMIALEKEAVSPAGVDTSKWPTYTNKKYGFSFKYPEGILIEGDTGFEKTHPEYAKYVTLLAKFNETESSRFFLSIKIESLTAESDRCIPGPRLPLEEFATKLREMNIENNESHKKWNDATVSDVIALTSGKEKGYMLTFDELVYDGCTSMGWGGVDNQPFRVYRLYEDTKVRLQAENTYPREKQENPLYQVILDTLEFQKIGE